MKHAVRARAIRLCGCSSVLSALARRSLLVPLQEKRAQKAAEGKQKLADREADYKQREKDLKEMKKNTKAKVDDDVNDDLIDVDGDGVADMTAGVSDAARPVPA